MGVAAQNGTSTQIPGSSEQPADSLPAQWDLQACIDYALQQNITIRKNRLNAESAQVDVKTARAALFPSLSASVSQRVVNRPKSETNTTIDGDNITSSQSKTSYNGSYGIDAVAAVIGSLALAAGDVVAVDGGVCLALRAIHDTLAHTGRKAGEESGSGGLYIYLGTFRVEAVLADGDVLLQGIVDARLQVPLGGQAVGWLLGTAGYLRGSAVLGGHSHAACHT